MNFHGFVSISRAELQSNENIYGTHSSKSDPTFCLCSFWLLFVQQRWRLKHLTISPLALWFMSCVSLEFISYTMLRNHTALHKMHTDRDVGKHQKRKKKQEKKKLFEKCAVCEYKLKKTFQCS